MRFQKIQTQVQLTHVRCYLNIHWLLWIITPSSGLKHLHIYSSNKGFMCDVSSPSLNCSSSWKWKRFAKKYKVQVDTINGAQWAFEILHCEEQCVGKMSHILWTHVPYGCVIWFGGRAHESRLPAVWRMVWYFYTWKICILLMSWWVLSPLPQQCVMSMHTCTFVLSPPVLSEILSNSVFTSFSYLIDYVEKVLGSCFETVVWEV